MTTQTFKGPKDFKDVLTAVVDKLHNFSSKLEALKIHEDFLLLLKNIQALTSSITPIEDLELKLETVKGAKASKGTPLPSFVTARPANVLASIGIHSLEEAANFHLLELMALYGVEEKALFTLAEAMRKRGLWFNENFEKLSTSDLFGQIRLVVKGDKRLTSNEEFIEEVREMYETFPAELGTMPNSKQERVVGSWYSRLVELREKIDRRIVNNANRLAAILLSKGKLLFDKDEYPTDNSIRSTLALNGLTNNSYLVARAKYSVKRSKAFVECEVA